jgi:hypothetical protein
LAHCPTTLDSHGTLVWLARFLMTIADGRFKKGHDDVIGGERVSAEMD